MVCACLSDVNILRAYLMATVFEVRELIRFILEYKIWYLVMPQIQYNFKIYLKDLWSRTDDIRVQYNDRSTKIIHTKP